jgi:hypothetical protein
MTRHFHPPCQVARFFTPRPRGARIDPELLKARLENAKARCIESLVRDAVHAAYNIGVGRRNKRIAQIRNEWRERR